MDWKLLPKVELHCHLDGILDSRMVRDIYRTDPTFPINPVGHANKINQYQRGQAQAADQTCFEQGWNRGGVATARFLLLPVIVLDREISNVAGCFRNYRHIIFLCVVVNNMLNATPGYNALRCSHSRPLDGVPMLQRWHEVCSTCL